MSKMNIFKVDEETRKNSIDELLRLFTADELIEELKACGLATDMKTEE